MNLKNCMILLILILILISPAQSQPDIRIESESIPCMNILDVPDASGGKVARLGADMGSWAWTTVDLGNDLPAGSYRVTFRLYGAKETAARTLFYWQKGTDHLPPYGLQLPSYTDNEFHDFQLTLNADTPFRNLILKHGNEAGTAGIAIDWLKIEPIPYTPPYRVTAYKRALAFPYPAGIDTAVMIAEVEAFDNAARTGRDTSKYIARIERWLELTADLVDYDQQIRYIQNATSVPELKLGSLQPNTGKLAQQVTYIKSILSAGEVDLATKELSNLSSSIDVLVQSANKRAGGQILPDYQADPFTWLRAPILQGFVTDGTGTNISADKSGGPFASEPTPFKVAWLGGPTLNLASPAMHFLVDHSWTGAVWKSKDFSMAVSDFSPAIRLNGLESFSIPETKVIQKIGRPDTLNIQGKSWQLLITASSGKLSASVNNDSAQVSLPRGATVWMLPIRNLSDAETWRKTLPAIPTDAIQIRRGNTITQYFIGGKKLMSPIPPMLQLALTSKSTSAPKALWKSKITVVEGKWGKALRNGEFDFQFPFSCIHSKTLSYRLPKYPDSPLTGRRGINIWSNMTMPEDIAILAKDGVNYIRIVVIDPPKEGFEAWFAPLKPILVNCRRYGIKASIDAHFIGPGDVELLKGVPDQKLSFPDFWQKVALACKDYRDVVTLLDLRNEPGEQSREENNKWFDLAGKAIAAIRKVDPQMPVLVEAGRGANPSGFPLLRKMHDSKVIYGVHIYYPHGFTHQSMLNKAESPEDAPVKPYPSWIPIINWRDESWDAPVEWWDRWTLRGSCLPVFRWWIKNGYPPLDVGEFGVIGYAESRSGPSIARWTRDEMLLNETLNASWTLYGYHGGFGWTDSSKPIARQFWKRNHN